MTARYSVKFTNHYWKVFDNEYYGDVALHYLRKEALEHAKKLNQKKQ